MIGHLKQKKLLENLALSDDMPHALLFSGQEQLGKKLMATELAKTLFCEKKNACGKCKSCKDIENNRHPDVISNSGFQIKDVRDLIWKLSLKPYGAPFKIAIIDNAHQLNAESQNCFLKTLEEPKGKALIIMVTSYPEMMLPTILSRVQQIKFFPVKSEEIEKHFSKQIALLAMGRPGRAMEMASNNDKIIECERMVSDLEKISESDLGARFGYAKKIIADEEKGNLKEILENWLYYFRAMMLDKVSGKSRDGYPLLKIKKIINKMQTIYYLVSTTNVNQKLALEIVMMEL